MRLPNRLSNFDNAYAEQRINRQECSPLNFKLETVMHRRCLNNEYGTVKPKILIVDDNSMLRETTRHILESKFPMLRVFEAADGQEAFTKIHDHLPNLILMDIRLPGENGLKLTRKIKALYPKIVVIIFTSYDLPEYREAAFGNGAEFFLSKSSRDGRRLIAVVESLLAGDRRLF